MSVPEAVEAVAALGDRGDFHKVVGTRRVCHVGYQPDGSVEDRNYKLLPPSSIHDELGPPRSPQRALGRGRRRARPSPRPADSPAGAPPANRPRPPHAARLPPLHMPAPEARTTTPATPAMTTHRMTPAARAALERGRLEASSGVETCSHVSTTIPRRASRDRRHLTYEA